MNVDRPPPPPPPSPPSPPPPPPRSGGSGERLPGRRLAITGFVLALIPCCPLTGLAGAMLGALALRAARKAAIAQGNNDAKVKPGSAAARVRRFAFAALAIGISSALIWSAALDWLDRVQGRAREEAMIGQVATLLETAAAGDGAAALETWAATDTDRPTEELVLAFGRGASDRYGPFERFTLISTSYSGGLLAPIIEISGRFHFENESPLGAARFVTKPAGLLPDFMLTRLSIEDRERGDLLLGPAELRGDSGDDAEEGPDG